MKKILFSLILSVAAFASANADRYTGVLVTDADQNKTYYLFDEKPSIKYLSVMGVMNACLYTSGGAAPVVSVPLLNEAKLSVKYEAFVRVNLNSEGYATFSAKDASFIATEGVTAYKAAVDGEVITLTALKGNIPAGTGVLLYGEGKTGAKVNLPIATSGETANVEGNDMKATTHSDGSLAAKEDNSWVLGDANLFLRYTGNAFIHNRAYIVHEQASSAKAMRIVFADGETTGLDNVGGMTSAREGKFLENGNIVIVKDGKKYNVAGQAIKY